MASNTDGTRKTIEQLVEAGWDTADAPLYWSGTDFDAPDTGEWLECTVLMGDAFEDIMGGTGLGGNVLVGVLMVNVFGARGLGYGDLNRLADSVRDIVNRKTSGGIRFGVPSMPKKVPNDQHAQVNVTCPFETDETI